MTDSRTALWRDLIDKDQYLIGILRPHYKDRNRLIAQAYALLFVDAVDELLGSDIAAKARALQPNEFLIIHGIEELHGERRIIPQERFYSDETKS